MSLLLDALKKSGHEQNAAGEGGAPKFELSLEDAPPAPSAAKPAAAAPAAQGLPPRSEPARDAGKNLFSAKKPAPGKKMKIKLGIVPLTLIFALLFGSGYGYYVWLQIQPRPVARRVAPPPAPPVPAPAPAATAPAMAPPAAAPVQPVHTATPEPAPAIAPPAEKPPVTVHHRSARSPAQNFTIERQTQEDGITPLLQAAYKAYRAGDFATAKQKYGAVLRQDENNRDALLGLAAIAQQQGEDTAAAQHYARLLALDPRDPDAQAGISALEKSGGANKESRLKMLLEQLPQAASLHYALGNLYSTQSRWSEAQQAYFDAYTLRPDAAQYAYNLAISLDHLGQAKLAAQYYQRALQLDAAGSAGIDHPSVEQRLNQLQH